MDARRMGIAAGAGLVAVVMLGLTAGRAQDGKAPAATVEQRLERIERTLATLVDEVRAVSAKVDRLVRPESREGAAAGIVETMKGRVAQAQRVKTQVVLKNVRVALEMYCLDNGKYPTTEEGLGVLTSKPTDGTRTGGPYLELEPGLSRVNDAWGNAVRYRWPAPDGRSADFWSTGPDGQDGTDDDVRLEK